MSWFMCSVCPSVCGWYAVYRAIAILRALLRSLVNFDANCGPLSDVMWSGNPCSFQMLSRYSLAMPSELMVSLVGMAWTIFVKQSMTTMIALYLWLSGSPVTKSADISFQGASAMGFG